jgi:hypothetical protein
MRVGRRVSLSGRLGGRSSPGRGRRSEVVRAAEAAPESHRVGRGGEAAAWTSRRPSGRDASHSCINAIHPSNREASEQQGDD